MHGAPCQGKRPGVHERLIAWNLEVVTRHVQATASTPLHTTCRGRVPQPSFQDRAASRPCEVVRGPLTTTVDRWRRRWWETMRWQTRQVGTKVPQDHPDLRGHQPDPADGDGPGPAQVRCDGSSAESAVVRSDQLRTRSAVLVGTAHQP
jgi:hypothetical protein